MSELWLDCRIVGFLQQASEPKNTVQIAAGVLDNKIDEWQIRRMIDALDRLVERGVLLRSEGVVTRYMLRSKHDT